MNNVINIENARLIFRNFSGRESKFNRPGDKNFCVVIEDEELVDQLTADGWNVKIRPPREEGDEALNYLKVNVSYRIRPPKVEMVLTNSNKIVPLNEETVGQLDYADILRADVVISPHEWEQGGRSGVSAYLKAIYITVDEDVFADKYSGFDRVE